MFSKACEYAIKAMIYIKANSADSRKISLNEIAKEINSPVAFTSKILQQLKKSGLLLSTIGAKGGFEIKTNKKIFLRDILVAIDGDKFFSKCVLGLNVCSSANPCPVHKTYTVLKEKIIQDLLALELNEFSSRLKNKSISLK